MIYQRGGNVTQFLRKNLESQENTSKIIEIAYDLQAGSYIEFTKKNSQKVRKYTRELSIILKDYLDEGSSLLDVGTGEMTILTFVLNQLKIPLLNVLALDLSWSRLSKGMNFFENNKVEKSLVSPFVADIKKIPLHSKSIDVTISSHALEPNGQILDILLYELFRVTKKHIILFEPSFEINSKEGKQRMDNLGYIKDLPNEIEKIGGKILNMKPITNVFNPLNPTVCYVIRPPKTNANFVARPEFCVPGTDFPIYLENNFLVSRDTGLVFPVLDDIPVLKMESSILATSKS